MPTIDPNTTQKRQALALLNTVLGEIGMPPLTSVSEGTDTSVQLLYLANGFGSRLAMLPFWATLTETFTTVTVDSQTEYDLPVDWGVPLASTAWDRTSRWPLIGPVTAPQWQILQSSLSVAAPQYRFRFSDLKIQISPAPPAGLTLAHEYLSTGWALGLSGDTATVRKPRITSDEDYVLFSEEMFLCGVKAAWLGAKGLDNRAAVAEFKEMLEASWAATNSASILPFGGGCAPFLLGYQNVPDTGYGS
jgi:hypothetical protein